MILLDPIDIHQVNLKHANPCSQNLVITYWGKWEEREAAAAEASIVASVARLQVQTCASLTTSCLPRFP